LGGLVNLLSLLVVMKLRLEGPGSYMLARRLGNLLKWRIVKLLISVLMFLNSVTILNYQFCEL